MNDQGHRRREERREKRREAMHAAESETTVITQCRAHGNPLRPLTERFSSETISFSTEDLSVNF
jgi:hypothetical protein